MFDTITSIDTLHAAWKRVRSNRGGPGGDTETLDEFGRAIDERLRGLRGALRSRRYRPGPLRVCPVAKPDGSTRLLRIPCITDRVIQTACATALSAALDRRMNGSSFGYRPARSVAGALARLRELAAKGDGWVLDADIERFFDRVPHGALLDELEIWTGDGRLVALVGLWLRGFGRGRGLAQGAPVSPVLANLYLHPLDESLARAGLAHIRYADDFVVLTPNRDRAWRARRIAATVLRRRGLTLSAEKTRIVAPGTPFGFLGEEIVLGEPSRGPFGRVGKPRKTLTGKDFYLG